MTYLQLVNAVLRRLREDEVTSVSQSAYSKLIGDFVNEAKREVEDAWNWVQLRTTIQVNTVNGTFRYTLTGAGDRFRILQVVNDTENYTLELAPYDWMNEQFTMVGSGAQEGSPYYFDVNGQTSGDPDVDFYPIPNAVETINFNVVLPQDDFTSDSDELTVPFYPVILGAYMKSISERGEDGGQNFGEIMNDYMKALSDAVAIDGLNVPHELIWNVR